MSDLPEVSPQVDESNTARRDSFLSSVKRNHSRNIKVKDFIALWGYRKRGSYITKVINNELKRRGLASVPDLAKADYYGSITIIDQRDVSPGSDAEVGWPISTVLDDEKILVSAGPDDSLLAVETEMLACNFSQIPVLSRGGRQLHGSVTWKSLARWQGSRIEATARQAMDTWNRTARSSDPLLDHIGSIVENDFMYIQDPTGLYVGIITATDLAASFLATAGPFVKIGEIEDRLRQLINRLPLQAVRAAQAPGFDRAIMSASDLTFGEYLRVIENPENWTQLSLPLDRATVVRNLKEVNEARNHIMHFRPGRFDPQLSASIDHCLNWIRTL